MTRRIAASAALLLFAASTATASPLRVICTLPTLAAIVTEVGGDAVTVTSLAKGDQDPHFVSPTPLLMKRTREADLFVELGLSLDRWADEVVNGSGNSRILRGRPGRLVAATGVPVLEVPSVVSRELGDIHPEGNPHVWLDPLRAKMLAVNVARAIQALRPEAESAITENLSRFQSRIDEKLFGQELIDLVGAAKLARIAANGELDAYLDDNVVDGEPLRKRLGGWMAKAAPLSGLEVLEYHKVWIYFTTVFGMRIAGEIEERPGIPPGPQHQRRTIELIRSRKIPLILVDNFYDPKLPEFIAAESGAVAVSLPNQVGGEPGVDTYFALVDHVLDRLLASLARARR